MQLIAGCTESYLDIFMLSCRAGIWGQIANYLDVILWMRSIPWDQLRQKG